MTDAAPLENGGGDAAGYSTSRQRRRGLARSLVVLGLGLGCAWLAATWFVPLILVALGAAVYFLMAGRWAALAGLLLLSPTAAAFVLGIVGYARGTAALHYMGLPGTTFHNLDPEVRCPRYSGGCVVTGSESLTQPANNGAVRLMTALFGPMPGAYDGPYPSREQALAALADAEATSWTDLLTDTVRVGGETIELDSGVGRELLEGFTLGVPAEQVRRYAPAGEEAVRKRLGEVRAALWHERCLILRVPSIRPSYGPRAPDEPSAMIAVFDRRAGRPFAYYGQGDYYQNFPPVMWRED